MANSSIILLGHGSRPQSGAPRSLEPLAQWTAQALGQPVLDAYLEMEPPSLEARMAELEALGVRSVLVMPAFLSLGAHLRQDIPELLTAVRATHPRMQLAMTEHLGALPDLAQVAAQRVRAAQA